MESNADCQIFCECGQRHSLETQDIVVADNAFDLLVADLCNSQYKRILVVHDLKAHDNVSLLTMALKEESKEIEVVSLQDCCASLKLAQEVEDKGQELVVALGGEELISVSKYYAYCYECPLMICAEGNFIDITFSQFARLYDGVEFNIYKTNPPIKIFVPLCQSDYVSLHSYYISSKYIAMFDNVISEQIFGKIICKRLKDYLKETLSYYMSQKGRGKQEQNYKNIWTLIRLGQGMSFFGQTTNFFGGDYAIASLMQAQRFKADFLEIETIALKLVINSYACFFNSGSCNADVNVNRHIQGLSNLLKIPPTECLKRLTNSSLLYADLEQKRKINNYLPYLKGVLKKSLSKVFMIHSSLNITTNVLKKYNFMPDRVEKSFALASCLSHRPTTLHILTTLGYMDKLL